MVADVDGAAATLQRLRALGVQFALDDFGTGHSSLTLLRRLPLDTVKVDRSLIRRVAVDASDAVLVQLAVDAAHTLGLRVCAEGIEELDRRSSWWRWAATPARAGCSAGRRPPPRAGRPWPLTADAAVAWLRTALTTGGAGRPRRARR